MLQDIHGALVGNPTLGNPGLVKRVETGETRTEQLTQTVADHSRRFWFVSTLGTALWATLVAFKENIFHK